MSARVLAVTTPRMAAGPAKSAATIVVATTMAGPTYLIRLMGAGAPTVFSTRTADAAPDFFGKRRWAGSSTGETALGFAKKALWRQDPRDRT
jgi:hypothetical protein